MAPQMIGFGYHVRIILTILQICSKLAMIKEIAKYAQYRWKMNHVLGRKVCIAIS